MQLFMKAIVHVLIGLFAGLFTIWGGISIAASAELPAYRADRDVSGEIRISGSPQDGALLQDWQNGFRRLHPQVRFSEKLYGPESTLAGVYTGTADLAFMAREQRLPMEGMAFEWVHRHEAFEIEVANGGLGNDRPSEQIAVFVHKTNPLEQLTLTQLDAILGAEHKRGASNIRSWSELGLVGQWSERSIHAYGPEIDSIAALFIRRVVLLESRKWNPDYTEFASAAAVLDALARDPAGIAYGPLSARNENVKPIALAANHAGPFHALTAQTVTDRSYPLTRVVTMVLDRDPGRPIEPRIREFLRYILSREGQAAVARAGTHLPLSAERVSGQLERLGP